MIILSAFTFDGCTLKYLQKNLYAVRDLIQNNKLGRGEPMNTDEQDWTYSDKYQSQILVLFYF